MRNYNQANQTILPKIYIPASVIVSGVCWFFSLGLNGDFWYLLWFAPVPVLLISFNATPRTTFLVSFIAYLIGRLSWFSYLEIVGTLIPAIIITLALPLIFALIVIATRKVVLESTLWYSVFAFPVFFTAFEYLLIKFSPDGTAASIAYSQLNFLPVIQIASVTGILGITFIVTFIPSAFATGWYYRKEKRQLIPLTLISLLLAGSVFVFGIIRLSDTGKTATYTVGLAVLDEKFHKIGNELDFKNELQHVKNYAEEVKKLADQGAKLVVLPERAININSETDSIAISILSKAAKQYHVAIVTGYTNFRNAKARNSAFVINSEGNVITSYNKAFLIKGLESQFTAGNTPAVFTLDGIPGGTAICKDLDFPDYIKNYGDNNIEVMYIPAWDFVVDDWLHSRMAILRGVENGFSEVRTARLGRLTISDCYGRVSSEKNSNGEAASLTGRVSIDKKHTLYTRFSDWFGIINFVSAAFLLLTTITKSKMLHLELQR